MMQRRMCFLAAAAVFAAGASLCVAQNIASAGPPVPSYTQSQPAPIERAYPNQSQAPYGQYSGPHQYNRGPYQPPMPAQVTLSPGSSVSATTVALSAAPIPGVILRVAPNSSVKEVVSNSDHLELRIESGIANLNVHDPEKNIVLLVDLPGGQVQTLKNGLYTFNAATNTARVLKGEALAFSASSPNAHPMKVKEYNKIEFGKDTRPHEFVPQQALADLIPAPPRGPEEYGGGGYGYGYGNAYAPGYGYGPGYGYAPYGDGYPYGYYPYYSYYPYYAGFYPWGYPYGFYPGFGFGFGYFGGFHGGFHGGGFHGRR